MAERKRDARAFGKKVGRILKGSDKRRNRQVRLSQTVVPFGVGNIYDFLGESFVGCDTYHWGANGIDLVAPRLASALGVNGFRTAPVQSEAFGASRGPGVPYYRFPEWLFCQNCRGMLHWRKGMEQDREPARCPNCQTEDHRPQLVPMRFVLACENGHLGDVPWELWAHANAKTPEQKRCGSAKLRFETKAAGGSGLETLILHCVTCGTRNTLKGIASKNSLQRFKVPCPGKQPWEKWSERRDCNKMPQVLQRGASNLYYGTVHSAIDIPPHSDYDTFSDLSLRISSHELFRAILALPNLVGIQEQLIAQLCAQAGCKPDEVRSVVRRELQAREGHATPTSGTFVDLQSDEWNAFITPQRSHDDRDRFITRHTTFLQPGIDKPSQSDALALLDGLISQVVLAVRLREVRALVNFSRLLPEQEKLQPGLDHDVNWLPAIEVFGEGIFLRLSEDQVQEWESSETVIDAAKQLETRRVGSLIGARLKEATPRFVLLHTLAHLLIRQLTFECGYSASSIRERIYSKTPDQGDPQAGLLLYTAAGDVEGTLGGLVRQGEPPRLHRTILTALERGAWCSSDPICRESSAQGFEGLNRGACHACCLVAETSCDGANALLDRSFVVGGSDHGPGFFEQVLEAASSESLRARSG